MHPDRRARSAKLSLPETVADHDGRGTADVTRGQRPSARRRQTERLKEFFGHRHAHRRRRFTGAAHQVRAAERGGHNTEGAATRLPRDVASIGQEDGGLRRALARGPKPDDEAIGMREGERLEQPRVDDAEHRHRRADAGGERCQHDRGEDVMTPQQPQSVEDVAREILEHSRSRCGF